MGTENGTAAGLGTGISLQPFYTSGPNGEFLLANGAYQPTIAMTVSFPALHFLTCTSCCGLSVVVYEQRLIASIQECCDWRMPDICQWGSCARTARFWAVICQQPP